MMDKRTANRADVSLEAIWDGCPPNSVARIADLSENGCFIDTIAHAKEGEIISVTVLMPRGEQLHLKGLVVHHVPSVGFGLTFTEVSDAAREKIRDLIEARFNRDEFERPAVDDLEVEVDD